MPLGGLGIGAGVGLLKYLAVDKPQENKQRALAATTQRYSPWTGLQAQQIPIASSIGDVASGAGQGAALGSNIVNSNAANAYLKAKTADNSFSGMPQLNFSQNPWQMNPSSGGTGLLGVNTNLY